MSSRYEEMTDSELWQAQHNLLNGIWKWPAGAFGKWPTQEGLRAEMKKREGWITCCEVCWEWFPMKDEDTHDCHGPGAARWNW
jgi:hypothetical protein